MRRSDFGLGGAALLVVLLGLYAWRSQAVSSQGLEKPSTGVLAETQTAPRAHRRDDANGPYRLAGCPLFPGTRGGDSGGWFDTDVYNAPVATNVRSSDGVVWSSAQVVNNWMKVSPGGIQVFNPPYAEVLNTPSSVKLYPIAGCTQGGMLPVTCSMPGPASQYSENGAPQGSHLYWEAKSGSDNHYNVLERSTCKLWTATIGGFSAGAFSTNANLAGLFDLTKPFPQRSGTPVIWDQRIGGAPGGTCCGIPTGAGGIKASELAYAVANGLPNLHHALLFNAPGNEKREGYPETPDADGYVPPAVTAQGTVDGGCSSAGPCMPYGAHIRLKRSFDDSRFSPRAKIVAETLKHYGAYLMDTGCCFYLMYLMQDSGHDMKSVWTSSDSANLHTIDMNDFDVIAPDQSNAPN